MEKKQEVDDLMSCEGSFIGYEMLRPVFDSKYSW